MRMGIVVVHLNFNSKDGECTLIMFLIILIIMSDQSEFDEEQIIKTRQWSIKTNMADSSTEEDSKKVEVR